MANISIYDPRTMGKLVERMPKVQTFIKSTFPQCRNIRHTED